MINEDRVKQLFLDLVQINSPSRHERGVADYVSAKLRSLGLEVEEDNAGSAFGGDTGNVIGFKKEPSRAPERFSCAATWTRSSPRRTSGWS